jgi:hypothetical protein
MPHMVAHQPCLLKRPQLLTAADARHFRDHGRFAVWVPWVILGEMCERAGFFDCDVADEAEICTAGLACEEVAFEVFLDL